MFAESPLALSEMSSTLIFLLLSLLSTLGAAPLPGAELVSRLSTASVMQQAILNGS